MSNMQIRNVQNSLKWARGGRHGTESRAHAEGATQRKEPRSGRSHAEERTARGGIRAWRVLDGLQNASGAICSSDAEEFTSMADAEASATMAEEGKPDAKTVQVLRDMANRLRIHSIRATCASSFG